MQEKHHHPHDVHLYHEFTAGQVVFLFGADIAAATDELLFVALQVVYGRSVRRYQVVAGKTVDTYIPEADMQLHYFLPGTDGFAVRHIGVENEHVSLPYAV